MAAFAQTQLNPGAARGVVRGDRDAVAAAYRVLSQPVMNMATRILQDRNLAEEVVQDTFIDLVEKGSQIRAPEAVVGWVKSVATNHCLMKLRSPWMSRRHELDPDVELEQQTSSSDAWQQAQTIEQALARLPADTRAVLWLHDVEGYTHKEIAERMGKTASFSKSQLARGYEKLTAWSQRAAPRGGSASENDHGTDVRVAEHVPPRPVQPNEICHGHGQQI